MSVFTGTATDFADLMGRLNNALTTLGSWDSLTQSGTGNGTIAITPTAATIAETITVTFTSATAFTVSGSSTGAMGSGTVGTAFSHAKIGFTITAGGTAFIAGDNFVFAAYAKWVAVRSTAGVLQAEYVWQGSGAAGGDTILFGASTYYDAGGDYYNWRLGGFLGCDTLQPFVSQAGGQTDVHLPLWQNNIPYWIIANGRRVILIAQVSGRFEVAYLGLALPYASPGVFPYPLVVAGTMAFAADPAVGNASWRWSNDTDDHRAFWDPGQVGGFRDRTALRLRRADGYWQGFSNWSGGSRTEANPATTWPGQWGPTNLLPDLDGDYDLEPVILTADQGSGILTAYGELEGVLWVSGHSNAAGNTVTAGGKSHLVVPNVARIGKADFAALLLE